MPGGAGGAPFADEQRLNEPRRPEVGDLRKICIYHGSELEGLYCEYKNGHKTPHYGSGGGKQQAYTLNLESGEHVIGVIMWADNIVQEMQFVTNKRLCRRVGNCSSLEPVISLAPEGKVLYGFSGRSGSRIDFITPYWDTPVSPFPKKSAFSCLPARGKTGGSSFTGLPDSEQFDLSTARISAIEVEASRLVVSIKVYYNDNPPPTKGGTNTFILEPGEYISSVEGRSGARIDQICFITNKGRQSQVYGGKGGSSFQWKPASPNLALLFFQGWRDSESIISLRPWFSHNPVVRYELTNITYDFLSSFKTGTYEVSSKYVYNNSTASQTFTEGIHWDQKESFRINLHQQTLKIFEGEPRFMIGLPRLGGTKGKPCVKDSIERMEVVHGQPQSNRILRDDVVQIVVSSRSYCQFVLGYMTAKVDELPWRGELIITMADESSKVFPASGTLSGRLYSGQLQVVVNETPISKGGEEIMCFQEH